MAKAGFPRGMVDRFERDMIDVVAIAEPFVELAPKIVTPEVTRAARAGIGPDGERYPAYSDAYKKRKNAASGTQREFMVGIGKKGGLHMLSPSNFKWVISGKEVQLIWTGKKNQGDYGIVHHEGRGKMPRRTWMHLLAPRTRKIIDQFLRRLIKQRTDNFNAKYGKK